MTLRVLAVASEAYPLIKTGGLADVVGALPAALEPHGVEMTTLLPGYPIVLQQMQHGRGAKRAQVMHSYEQLMGAKARLLHVTTASLPLIVLDAPGLFAREGGPYADRTGVDWPDNWRRFAALAKAGADIAGGIADGYQPDLVHAHDWQAAMAPAFMRYGNERARRTPSVMTIHNLAFQGRFDATIFPALGLPAVAFAIDGVEYFGGVGFLKAGLQTAGAITTVSPTYAEEIRQAEFGMGLEGLIEARHASVHGIVNGIDTAIWNPSADANLKTVYTAASLAGRADNRRAVEQAFGLVPGKGPLFCVVSRLTWQKGMDVLAAVLDDLVDMGGRLAVLGTGDEALEAAFLTASERFPGKVGVRIGYDEALSHLLQGGADAILIPSRFEPCGLTQLYGLRYGCVPVVARTGGLADTVIDANEAAVSMGVATGYQFDAVTNRSLVQAVGRAIDGFSRTRQWRTMQRQGMKADFSWTRSGKRYADLYRQLAAGI